MLHRCIELNVTDLLRMRVMTYDDVMYVVAELD
jgi:hypothetical protein